MRADSCPSLFPTGLGSLPVEGSVTRGGEASCGTKLNGGHGLAFLPGGTVDPRCDPRRNMTKTTKLFILIQPSTDHKNRMTILRDTESDDIERYREVRERDAQSNENEPIGYR